jgi:predicted nucleotidyltransferase
MLNTKKPRIRSASRPNSALADALFGATQQRVLGLLFGQPNRSFFATEIMSLVGTGRGAVQRELLRLKTSGLVTVRKVGNQKHYQASRESPIYEELCSIIRKTIGLHEPLRAAIEKIQDKLQVAILYGSTVKGTDTAKSDIDVLIVSDSLTLDEAINLFSPVERILDRRISCTIYTPREFDDRRQKANPFITRVIEGPHVVLAGKLDGH